MHDPIALAELIAAGVADPAADAWFREGLLRWLRGGGDVPLPRILRLPATPAGVRRAIARRWLTEAAGALPDALSAWERARVLSEAVARFQARKWPAWRTLQVPPPDATRVEVCLWYALRSGARLPETTQGFLALTKQHEKLSGNAPKLEPLPATTADHETRSPHRRLRAARSPDRPRAAEA